MGGAPPTLRVRLRVTGRDLEADFSATDDQVDAPVNTPRAVALSAVFYCLRLLLPAGTPTNDGLLRPARVVTRPGSLVDARYPAPVAAGNVETSQRLVDVVLGALAHFRPDRVPAASAGTMSNLTFGGTGRDGGAYTYYETSPGGAGASPRAAGAHAVQTHMTNTRNTPIEALENRFPVRVLSLGLRRGSGGAGARRGGDGLAKRLLFLDSARIAWVAERQSRGAWGLAGGGAGAPGRARLRASATESAETLEPRAARDVPAGAVLELETPGGGGHGPVEKTGPPPREA